MSAPTGLVAAGTLALGSPALWLMAHGQLSFDDTMLRLGVCAAICWLALSMAAGLAPTPPLPRRVEDDGVPREEDPKQVP